MTELNKSKKLIQSKIQMTMRIKTFIHTDGRVCNIIIIIQTRLNFRKFNFFFQRECRDIFFLFLLKASVYILNIVRRRKRNERQRGAETFRKKLKESDPQEKTVAHFPLFKI